MTCASTARPPGLGRGLFRRMAWLVLLACLAASLTWSSARADDAEDLILRVPYVSQLTDSPYAGSNCGPSSVTMVLKAYGIPADLDEVRREANVLQGTKSPDSGIAIENLAALMRQNGLVSVGLSEGRSLRRWTLTEVREQLRQGNPVIGQMRYASLPGHEGGSPYIDHYIVIYGIRGDGFIYSDSAFPSDTLEGWNRYIDEERLLQAWNKSQFPRAGFATAPGTGYRPLPPALTPTRAPVLRRIGADAEDTWGRLVDAPTSVRMHVQSVLAYYS